MMLDLFLIFLCVFLLLSCAFWTYLLLFVLWYKVPLISTHKDVVKKMVELAEITTDQNIYDLGCGFAPMLFLSEKSHPKNSFLGIEVLTPILWFNRMKSQILKKNIAFVKSDFFKSDLTGADVIFCYLWDTIMDRIYIEIWPSLKPGCRIVSHDFPIKKLTPEKKIRVGKSTVYVYVKS